MAIATLAKNARDILSVGIPLFERNLLRSELFTDHRIADRRFLAALLPKNGVGAEVGVFTGLFSTVLLEIAKPRHVYFVDPWWEVFGPLYPDWGSYTAYGKLRTRVAYEVACRRISSSAERAQTDVIVDFATSFFERMPDRIFDWVYLDSTHTYNGTVAELASVRSKLKSGAIIAGDDWQGDPSHKHHGVAKAVTEAVSRGEYEALERLPAWQWTVRAL